MSLARSLLRSSPFTDPQRAGQTAGRLLRLPSRRIRILTLAGIYGLVFLFFASIWVSGSRDTFLNVSAEFVHLIIWFIGAAVAFFKLRPMKSRPRTAVDGLVAIFGIAFLFDMAGGIIWLYYNLHGNLVPFPSWADVGFGGYSLLWALGLLCFFSLLDTTVRDELGHFTSLLAATWSLTVLLITLIQGSSWTAAVLPKEALDIFYPFVWALNCALAGSLLFGTQHRRLQRSWRWFVVFVYAGSVVTFLTNIAYALTAAVPASDPAAKYLYYNGGPLDFLFATGDFLLVVGLVVIPLAQPIYRKDHDRPSRAVQTMHSPPPAAQPVNTRLTVGEGPEAAVRDIASLASDVGVRLKRYQALVETLHEEVEALRHEVEAQRLSSQQNPVCLSGAAHSQHRHAGRLRRRPQAIGAVHDAPAQAHGVDPRRGKSL